MRSIAAILILIITLLTASCGSTDTEIIDLRLFPRESENSPATLSRDLPDDNGTETYDIPDETTLAFETVIADESGKSFETTESSKPVATDVTDETTEAISEPPSTSAAEPETTSPPETTAAPERSLPVTEAEPPARNEPDSTQTVFWVDNGEVWHRTKECPSLSRSKNIRSGSSDAAMNAGKTRQCKRCYK